MQYLTALSALFGYNPRTLPIEPLQKSVESSNKPVAAAPEKVVAVAAPILAATPILAGSSLGYDKVEQVEKVSENETDLLRVESLEVVDEEATKELILCPKMDNAPATAKTEIQYTQLLNQCTDHSITLNHLLIQKIFEKQQTDFQGILKFKDFTFSGESLFDDNIYKNFAMDLAKIEWLRKKMSSQSLSNKTIDNIFQIALDETDCIMGTFLNNIPLKKEAFKGTDRTLSIHRNKGKQNKGAYVIERSRVLSVKDGTTNVTLRSFTWINRITIPETDLASGKITNLSKMVVSITHCLLDH